MYPHIQDVTAIMGKTVKNTGGVAALQKTDFSNPLKKTFHCVSPSQKSTQYQFFLTPWYSSTVFVLMVVVTLDESPT